MAQQTPGPRDINRLVALAGASSGFNNTFEHRESNDIFSKSIVSSASNVPRVKDRTALVLDALAAILVSESQGNVYAVGAQIQYTSGREASKRFVRLHIAANHDHDIPLETKTFLEDVWEKLQVIAEHNRQRLLRRPVLRKQKKLIEKTRAKQISHSSDMPGLPEPFSSLIRVIHKHCFKKWRRNLDKNYKDLLEFDKKFRNEVFPSLSDTDSPIALPLIFLLVKTKSLQDSIASYLKQGLDPVAIVDRPGFPKTIAGMQTALKKLNIEKWERIDEWHDHKKSLFKYFKKVVDFQIYAFQLEAFARSPHLYHVLKKGGFEIVCVPGERYTLDLSTSHNYWEAVIKKALASVGYEWNDRSNDAATYMSKATLPNEGVVHCECRILKHFADIVSGPPPISYIGVSKPSCAACSDVFHAWNDLYPKASYTTRGGSGKFYKTWAVPTGWSDDESDMLRRVYSLIASNVSDRLCGYGLATRMGVTVGSPR